MGLVQTAWPEGAGAGSVCMRINFLPGCSWSTFVSYENFVGRSAVGFPLECKLFWCEQRQAVFLLPGFLRPGAE
jgi:hypothetical protein